MAQASTEERVSVSELEEGDTVRVHVNGRAAKQLGAHSFDATIDGVTFDAIRLKPDERLQEGQDTHTWYTDIGYIHGHHDGLGRYSDIGKVRKVTQ